MKTLITLISLSMRSKTTPKSICGLRFAFRYLGIQGVAHMKANDVYLHYNCGA